MSSGAQQSRSLSIIPLCEPELQGNEWKYLKECLDTGWVSSLGAFVEQLESEVASYVGAENAIAVASGTAGLHVALRVVGVEPGDEVIVSDLSFVSAPNAVNYCGAKPIFMDASEKTWQMDTDKLKSFLEEECHVDSNGCWNRTTGKRIRAIVPVHILGLSCDMQRITELAKKHRVIVVEDAAEALGVRVDDQHVGTFGAIGVFSFNGNKILTTGGGGMLVTNDASYAKRARYLTTQAKDDPLEYLHNEIGYNYRLSNLHAALGVAQMERIQHFIKRKLNIALNYEREFESLDGVTLMPRPDGVVPTFWLYTVLLRDDVSIPERKKFIAALRDNGIGARPLWHPLNQLNPYQTCQAYRIEASKDLYRRAVSLPSSVGLDPTAQTRCIETFKKLLSE